jgi:hypothetical protein
MIAPMQAKLEKYWRMSWLALSVPVIMDPRFKFTYLEFRLPQVFPSISSTKLAKVKKIFKKLFEEYAKLNLLVTTQTQQGGDDMEMDMESNDPLTDWDRHLSLRINSASVGSSKLDAYWLKPPIARKDNFDILDWWKSNSGEYPILASMAKDALVVPASTVASESAFSTGRRVISDFRSRLTPDTAEALICLHDWFRTSSENSCILLILALLVDMLCILFESYNASSLQMSFVLVFFFHEGTTELSTSSVYDILGEEGLSI